MSSIGVDRLRSEIQIILQNADLNTLSSKKVRQMLEEIFQCDLTERKKEIDDIVMAEITTRDIQPIPKNQSIQIDSIQQIQTQSDQINSTSTIDIQQQENRPSTKRTTTTMPLKIERRRTCYNKELDISDQLAVVVGGHRMPRSEVVKRMWIYFREHNLLDPINKQWVNCDETLSRLFGRRRVRAFGMLKDLARHMSDPDKQ